ncbi:hypothetical protein K2173_025156 [Erythroxylum novogranatense]|uniref:Uncharacterized protein n=1 Tax=Erythroxylum novogranatense TaxID=1862640 RepID=A0AAV8SX16_9ROSI|nr:hypothetical protein K2173_025156 [Erythroxylum novogranatense]
MKASLKFREEQKPLFRAKVPLSILGLPFQSGIVAGESKELNLNLSTFFEAGPSFKLSYRPNDSWNPFSLVIKTGTGHFGSPVSSPMLMSAEFSLLARGNPCFMLHFKPQFGDFSIKKSQSSSVLERTVSYLNGGGGGFSDEDPSIEVVDSPVSKGGGFNGKKIRVLQETTATGIAKVFSGMEVAARTKLPVRSQAVMNFRWGVRVPSESSGGSDSTAAINLRKIPFLVMNKIGIEHVYGEDDVRSKARTATTPKKTEDLGFRNADVAEACLTVKRQLEMLQAENGLLKRAVDDLRHEFAGSKVTDSSAGKYRELERSEYNRNAGRRSNEKKSTEAVDASEELKKALKGATAAGGV